MSSVDVAGLLQEISPDQPSGTNLQFDPAFMSLEIEAAGKPERRIGDSVIPAEEPDWRDVKQNAVGLLARTKDLRIAVQLTRSLLRTDGLAGLEDGLRLIAGLLERYWDQVHPQLDPDDGNDPTLRVNVLAGLTDWDGLVRPLREIPLVNARRAGRYSLRDVEIANGSLPRPEGDGPVPETAVIEAAFMEAEASELEATAGHVRGAVQELARIASIVTEKVGASRTVDLGRLASSLKSAERALGEALARRGTTAATSNGESAASGGSPGGGARPMAGEITSREDVIRMLDKACEYFKRHEPSSPVPLLLVRAKRLISKDFMEIIKDLAPGGVSEIRSIGGLDSEE
jgi:type VI secretion system protein ImpA